MVLKILLPIVKKKKKNQSTNLEPRKGGHSPCQEQNH